MHTLGGRPFLKKNDVKMDNNSKNTTILLYLRSIIISIVVVCIPPTIWLFITGDFYVRKFIEFIGFIFLFSAFVILTVTPFDMPDWLQNTPGIYTVNLIPIALVSVPAYLLLTEVFKTTRNRALWISILGSVFITEMMGLVLMYLFGSGASP